MGLRMEMDVTTSAGEPFVTPLVLNSTEGQRGQYGYRAEGGVQQVLSRQVPPS